MKERSVRRCLCRVTKAVETELEGTVQQGFRNIEENDERCSQFEARFNIPGVLGVVDGSHIPCGTDRRVQMIVITIVRVFSIVLSAIVDAAGHFVNIDVGAPGSMHDSTIFLTSQIGRWMESREARQCIRPKTQFFIGDSAYKLRWYLMKAFDQRNVLPPTLEPELDVSLINRHICSTKSLVHFILNCIIRM